MTLRTLRNIALEEIEALCKPGSSQQMQARLKQIKTIARKARKGKL